MPEPEDAEGKDDAQSQVSVTRTPSAQDAAVAALASTCGMTLPAVVNALSTLAVACWSAHTSDELADVTGDDDDDPDDVEERTL